MIQKYNNKKYVFVDVFDTIIFRRIHPLEVLNLWSSSIVNLFDLKIDAKSFFNLRISIYCHLSSIMEPNYEQIIRKLYDKCLTLDLFFEQPEINVFISVCHDVEVALETRSQYPNQKMLKRLKKLKDSGKKLIAVSDFYLPTTDISHFISAAGFSGIFCDIFSSCDYNASKRKGDLFPIVLDKIACSPKESILIEDNRKNSIPNAKKYGIECKYIPNYFYKLSKKINYLLSNKYKRKRFLRINIKSIKNRKDPFIEYTVLFYIFTQRLFNELVTDKIKRVVFLSREGLFLKKLFDYYQLQNIPKEKRIETAYIKISRRSITNINEDLFRNPITTHMSLHSFLLSIGMNTQDNLNYLKMIAGDTEKVIQNFKDSDQYNTLLNTSLKNEYDRVHKKAVCSFKHYTDDIFGKTSDRTAIVDVGWGGSMQANLALFMKQPSVGYYIGVIDTAYEDISTGQFHKGIMFSNNHDKSPYFDYYRVNTQLYEQLLSAPHGGAVSYSTNDNDEVVVCEDWPDNEKTLYYNLISNFQKKSFPIFQRLVDSDLSLPSKTQEDKILSIMVAKSSLFTTKLSYDFLCELDNGFTWNFSNDAKGIEYNNIPKIRFVDMLVNPHTYLRYFVKLERYLKKRHFGMLYQPLARIYYWYIYVFRIFGAGVKNIRR